MKCVRLLFIALALSVPFAPSGASADIFGECARQKHLDRRIAACIEASRLTAYPWILHWVYRELARAYRERGELEKATASYAQSLAAEERQWLGREMEELLLVTQ